MLLRPYLLLVPTAADLKPFLQQRYDQAAWLPMLRQLLGRERVEFFAEAQPIANPDPERVSAAVQLGYADVGEATLFGTSQRLAVVEVTLRPDTTAIAQNRVGLRALTYPFIDNATTHGLLVFYHDPSQPDYRFSFQTRAESRAGSATGAAERRRYTFVLGPREAATTAAQRLAALGERAGRATLADLRETFSVERLSKDFFADYRLFYDKFTQHLAQAYRRLFVPLVNLEASATAALRRAAEDKLMRDYAKRLLGRLVFLHFLQKKGWMGCRPADSGASAEAPWEGGDPEFLLTLFRRFADPDRFHSSCLTKLFFETLNEPRPGDVFFVPGMAAPCRVPYLNGGLFDEDVPNGRAIDFPPPLFEAVLLFFGRYNFTIEENRPDDHDVGIDPEMLGHIFENLLEENRARGAIYTPRAIVRHMAQESLIAYLDHQLRDTPAAGGRPALARFVRAPHEGLPAPLRPYAARLNTLLTEVTICDPAIGSGAFPIGLLQELFVARLYLYPHLPAQNRPAFVPAEVKQHIVHHNIYGVDADEGAVGIARLRFWLALVVDADRPVLLPNLDYKVMQGDSLLESYRGHSLRPESGQFDFDKAERRKFRALKEELFMPSSMEDKLHLRRELDTQVILYFGERMRREQREKTLTLNNLRYQLDHAPRPAPTDPPARARPKQRARLIAEKLVAEAQAALDQVEADFQRLADLESSTVRPYFLWHLNFPEVFEHDDPQRRGFDIVIANPPYMRVQTSRESLTDQKKAYETAYEPVAKGAYDLANLFVYLAVERLLNARGTACFIFPHKFFNSAGAEAFRAWLLAGQYVGRVAHFGANRVFNAADTYVAVALLGKRRHESFELLKLPPNTDPLTYDAVLPRDENYRTVSYAQLATTGQLYGDSQDRGHPWLMLDSPAEYDLFTKLYGQGAERVSDKFSRIAQGIATGKDELYYFWGREENGVATGRFEFEPETAAERQIEMGILKPFVRGRNVQRFAPLPEGLYVLFPYSQDESDQAQPLSEEYIQTHYPGAYTWLKQTELEHRAKDNGSTDDALWYRYARGQGISGFAQPRLSSMDICTNYPNVTYNDGRFYHATTVYSWMKKPGTLESYDYLLALGNSRVMWWFLKRTGDTLQGDARRMKTNYLNPFPLPPTPAPSNTAAVEALVRCQRWLHDPAHAPTPAVHGLSNGTVAAYLQQVLDLAVCELYPALAERMQAREVDVLALLPADLAPVLGSGPLTPAAIGAVYAAWQQPASGVRNRQLLATTRVPEWLGAIFGA